MKKLQPIGIETINKPYNRLFVTITSTKVTDTFFVEGSPLSVYRRMCEAIIESRADDRDSANELFEQEFEQKLTTSNDPLWLLFMDFVNMIELVETATLVIVDCDGGQLLWNKLMG